MMAPHSMVRTPDGSVEKGNNMLRPPMPNPYIYPPSTPGNLGNITKNPSAGNPPPGPPGMSPGMPPNMPVYMPYPMDTRYNPYLGYDYIPKKP